MSNLDIKFKRLTPFKRCVLQNFPFIEEDFDALTNYGLLCKIVKYLNDVIASQNEVQNVTEQTVEAFNNLYDYVNNYFENLDVQEEIDNKLDEMAEDGTLESILAKVVDTDTTYYFHTVMASEYYRTSSEYAGMQGGCILPDGTIFQCTGKRAATDGKLLHFAQDGTLLNSANCDFGHCNSVTYNSKTGTVFITGDQPNGDFEYTIFEVNPSSLETVNTYDISDKDFPALPYGIVYKADTDEFIFVNPWNLYTTTDNLYMWKTSADFTVKETKTFNFKLRSTANLGRFGKYIAIFTISNTSLLLFNPETMEYVKQVNINDLVSDTWYITEPEWVDTIDEVVYMGFIPHSSTSPAWGGGAKIYAKCDLNNNYEELRRSTSEFKPRSETYYVDESATYNPLRDGTSSAPFRNIYEALNASLRQNGVTGAVTIHLDGSTDDLAPIFSVNKHYYIYGDAGDIKCLSNIYVNRGCNVVFYNNVILQGNVLEDALNLGDANIQVRGNLEARYISLSTGDKLAIASSTDAVINYFIYDDGADLSLHQGKLNNLRLGYVFQSSKFVFANSPNLASRIKGITLEIAESEGKYSWGFFGKEVLVSVRYKVNNIDYEPSITTEYGVYSKYVYPYVDSNSDNQTVSITYNTANNIQIADSGGTVSNKRVRVTGI